jgi:N-acetylmuramoyl-L-alanine amidase
MGGFVYWDEERQEVEIQLANSVVILGIGSSSAWLNDEEVELEVPALIVAKEGEFYGRTMIPARFTAEALGYDVDWDDDGREVIITTGDTGSDKDVIPDEEKDIITEEPAASFWEPFDYRPLDMINEAAEQKLIFLDVGHGGRDTGAIANKDSPDELYEKTVNLKVAMYLNEYLNEAGANVYLLRDDDTYFARLERPEIANSMGAQLYVAIHNNSFDHNWAQGTEVHYYDKIDEEERDEMEKYGIYSKDVAKKVQSEMLKALGTHDRGVKRSPKLVFLNKTDMPAIVIEGAFLSNEEDLKKIMSEEYAKRYAYAAAKGIISAMNEAYALPY